jgi:hypothetical protein
MYRRWLVLSAFTLLLAASGCHKHFRCYRHCLPCRALPVCDPCCGTSLYVGEAVPVEIIPPVVVGGPVVSGPVVSGPVVSGSPVVVGSPAGSLPLGGAASPAPVAAPLPMPAGASLAPLPTNIAPPLASSPLPR